MESISRQAIQSEVLSQGLSSIFDALRSIPGFKSLSDGGIAIVLNLTVLSLSIICWFLNSMFSRLDPVSTNLRAAHEMATKNKELEALLKERDDELAKIKHAADNDAQELQLLISKNSSSQELIDQLQERLAVIEPDLERLTEAHACCETDLEKEKESNACLLRKHEELNERLASSEQLCAQKANELEQLQERTSKLEAKYNELLNQKERPSEEILEDTLEDRIKILDDEIKQKILELEKSESERHQALEQSNKLLHMLDMAHTKWGEADSQMSKLREEMQALQEKSRLIEEEHRKKEMILKDVEEELKKLRNEHVKLESKHFNLSREHRSLLDQKALSNNPSELLGDLNSLGVERPGASSRMGALLSGIGFEASIWDEPPLMHPHQPQQRNGNTSEEFEGQQETRVPQFQQVSRSRRSDRKHFDL